MAEKIFAWFAHNSNLTAFKALRRGLMLTIPILFMGSFCLIILNFPVSVYQEFLTKIPFVRGFLLFVYEATLGIFSLYVVASISMSYAQAYAERHGDFFRQGAPFASTGAYLLLVGMGSEGFSLTVLSTRSLFIAIIAGLLGTALYCGIAHKPLRNKKAYASSDDSFLNRVTASVLPITVVVVLAAAANMAISYICNVNSVEELFFQGISAVFPTGTSPFESGLLYLFLNNFLWFLGIHGGNMLDGVAQSIFVPGTALNVELIASGLQPTEIVTKTFLDVFASIGGAGALFSLLLAIIIFGRHRSMKKLSGLAATPIVFNISEMMLFGLPVIWNPALLIPFILVPLVNFVIAYGATVLGLLPYVTVDVAWITPPLYGGYLATGSWAGVAVQLINLIVGMCIYLPFLRFYEKSLARSEKEGYEGLLYRFRERELESGQMALTSMPGTMGLLVRALSEDLRRALSEGTFDLYYQPLFDRKDRSVGAEALLRWDHPVHGMVYPPLLIKLAEEVDLLEDLERAVLQKALDDAQKIQRLVNSGTLNSDFSISVNATSRALQKESFVDEIIQGVQTRRLDAGRLVVEATEHDALNMNDKTDALLKKLVDAGILLAIDDFSMGHTSFRYLETSAFSIVKLDGTIARSVADNARSADIVSSITRLSEQLGFKVLAEYVETREQRNQLEALGCAYFQGYFYSPALPLEDMLRQVQ